MANEFYTLIVVPHAKARFRKIQVSVRLTKWVFGTAAVATLAVSGTFVHYARVAAEVHELRQLRNENKVLLSKTQEYEQSAGKLQAKVQQLQNMVTKLGVMAGLEHSLPEPAGVGGVSSMDSTPPKLTPSALADMDRSLTKLTDRSAELEEFYRDQTVLLSSTPSVWPVRGYLVVTRYGHLDSFAVKPGQRVKRGDVIAFVGSTGRSTGPHLHYEVWVRDQAQNPIHFILDEYR